MRRTEVACNSLIQRIREFILWGLRRVTRIRCSGTRTSHIWQKHVSPQNIWITTTEVNWLLSASPGRSTKTPFQEWFRVWQKLRSQDSYFPGVFSCNSIIGLCSDKSRLVNIGNYKGDWILRQRSDWLCSLHIAYVEIPCWVPLHV